MPAPFFGSSGILTKTHAGWTVGGSRADAVTNNWSVRRNIAIPISAVTMDLPFSGPRNELKNRGVEDVLIAVPSMA